MDRKVEAAIPAPPNVDTRRKPIEEQLAQVLETTLNVEPEKKEARFIFNFECFKTYRFILTIIPNNIEVSVVRIKPITASSGR